ncbi:unnamed protein product, partial [Iphiclides podalirius]
MPEDQSAGPDLGRVLEHLDDFALNAQNYQTIQDALEKTQGNIEVSVVEKLLALCVRDLKEDMKNTVNTLKVLAAVLKKIKAGELYQLPDLVPSAVAVLHIIKTTALLNKVEGLKMLCYEILQSYPNEILITLAVSHYSEIMEMLNLYCHQRIPLEMRMQPINIIYKLLKILPPDKRTIFVRDGVGIWFSKIVPTVMSFATNVNGKNTVPLETLEMLTEELVGIDYLHNPNWKAVLECVHTQQKYPAVIKDLLDSGKVSKSTDRYNLFVELLAILEVLLQSPRCDKLADIIFNIVTYSLIDHNGKVQPLFNAKNEKNSPIHKIVSLILNPSLDYVFTRYDAKEIVAKIKPLTKLIAEEYLKEVTEGYLKSPLVKNNSLMLWTALAEAICELKCDISVEILQHLLILPLKSMSLFTSVEISSSAWFLLYKYGQIKLHDISVDEEICEIISNQSIISTTNKIFIFRASLVICNNIIADEKDNLICKVAETLHHVTNEMEYTSKDANFSCYSNIILFLLEKVYNEPNEKLAKVTVSIANNLLKMMSQYYKQEYPDKNLESNLVVQVLEQMQLLFKKEIYTHLKSIVLDDLKKFIPYFKHSGVLSILNSMLNQKGGKSETVSSSVPIGFQTLDKEKVKTPNINDQNKFTTPAVKPVAKKEKKKDSNIIDTVVENGEEYVVVKSNWKFNITKLTANQKEKLRRTREDIPALYQDLSQSQDEFKRVYRMNSVDSMSGMSSKSTGMEKEDATEVLKKMASSSVVPRIIENILTESNKTDCTEPNRNIVESAPPNIDNDHKHIEAKTCKSPRVALKDRVFRNVRNLIEKSGLQNDAKELNSTVNENLLKTPPKKQNVNKHLANSAPPEISSERPSRVKRKPKKFDDLNILPSKKRRTSTNQNNSEALGVKASETQTAESEGSKKPKLNLVDETISTTACEVTKTVTPDGNVSEQNVGQIVDSTNAFSTLGDLDNNAADIKPKNDFLLKEEPDIEEKQDAKYSEPSCGIENLIETDSCNLSDDKSFSKLITPNKMCKEQNAGVPTAKKSGRRKSRIEKELAIDMVEGHPFLKMQSEKRLTRKNINITSPALVKRKTLVEKLNKSKTDTNVAKSEKKQKNKDKLNSSSDEKQIDTSEDIASSQSQDIIESSQDSTVSSSISVKTCKKPKRIPIVSVEPCTDIPKALQLLKEKQDLTNGVASISDDIELGHNKTVVHDGVDVNSTENMDTLPVERDSSSDVIIRSYGEAPIVSRIDQTDTESGTQKTANEDTQSLDPALFSEVANSAPTRPVEQSTTMIEEKCNDVIHATPDVTTQRFDGAQTIAETANVDTDCSPFKDEAQRKQDFMNNTLEISPIKMLSPLQEEKKSPTLETSSDFMVITLSSPVQSNGEPFDKSDSPEIFSNDKISPDKRDQSPPRDECVMSNLSPSSSLSLKKNRPQVRSGGRAAQMLGLCVPDRMQTLTSSEKSVEPEEHRRSMALNTSARRNLRILYNSTGENSEAHDGSEESEFFLKLKRSIPTADSSPSGPILKRKLNDIVDETTVSPASKRKRVSFHDPPVSTTVCVKKYIEPSGLHSPQNSALKRQERQLRAQTTTKTPKRLDTVFKLDTVLTRAVESFSENGTNVAGVTPISQLEQTRLAEVVTTSDLNGTEPVCPALVHCKDGIDRIATKLSSPAKKLLLIREFEGKVETIGDLAKMTELEVNSLSIKAPKVEVAKRVLNDYALRSLRVDSTEACECIDLDDEPSKTDTHTDGTPVIYKEMQTDDVSTVASEQIASTCSDVTQTVEPGANSTSNLIISSLSEVSIIQECCILITAINFNL